jgi:phage gpG-like protein
MAIQGVRLNVADSLRVKRFLAELEPNKRRGVVSEVLRAIGNQTKADARQNRIVRGRGNAKPLARKLSWRSGELTRSIDVDYSRLPKRAIVGSRLKYAPVHEQGISPYPRRPYLEPAAKNTIKLYAREYFSKALARARRSV